MTDNFPKRRDRDAWCVAATSVPKELRRLTEPAPFITQITKTFGHGTSIVDELRRLSSKASAQAGFNGQMSKRFGQGTFMVDEMERLYSKASTEAALTAQISRGSIVDEMERLSSNASAEAAYTAQMSKSFAHVPPIAEELRRLTEQVAFVAQIKDAARSISQTLAPQPAIPNSRLQTVVEKQWVWSTRMLTQALVPNIGAARAAAAVGALDMSVVDHAFWNSVRMARLSPGMSAQVFTGLTAVRLDFDILQQLRSRFPLIDALAELEAESGKGATTPGTLTRALATIADRLNLTDLSLFTKRVTFEQLLQIIAIIVPTILYVHQDAKQDARDAKQDARDAKQDADAAVAARENAEREEKSQRILEALLAIQAAQQQTLDRLSEEPHDGKPREPYCVVRESPLRSGTQSKRVGTVYEGDIVEVGQRRGQFAKVWYFDPLEEVVRSGWIAKNCLARIW